LNALFEIDRIYNIVCTVLRNVKLFINLNFCIYQDVWTIMILE